MASAATQNRNAPTTTIKTSRRGLKAAAAGAALLVAASAAAIFATKNKPVEGPADTVIHKQETPRIIKDQSRILHNTGIRAVGVTDIIINTSTGQTCYTDETKTPDACRAEVGLPQLKKPQP